jgi:hypothetical protein
MAELGYRASIHESVPPIDEATTEQVLAAGETCDHDRLCREWNETRSREIVGLGAALEVQLDEREQRLGLGHVWLFVAQHKGDSYVVVYHGAVPNFSDRIEAEMVRIHDHIVRRLSPTAEIREHGPAFSIAER